MCCRKQVEKKLLIIFITVLLLNVIIFCRCFEDKKEHQNEQNEIEDSSEIHIDIPENLKLIENMTNFNMTISNSLNATILIHDCFNLEKYSQENQIFEFNGRFKNSNGKFVIDLIIIILILKILCIC